MKQSQIKQAISEALLESLNEVNPKRQPPAETPTKTWNLDAPVKPSAPVNIQDPKYQFENGKKWGLLDKLKGTERELDKYPAPFVKGYKLVQNPGWWSKFNDKLTQLLAQLGSGASR